MPTLPAVALRGVPWAPRPCVALRGPVGNSEHHHDIATSWPVLHSKINFVFCVFFVDAIGPAAKIGGVMYNTTHTHEATDTVENVNLGTLLVQQVFTVDTDENGELVQAEVELVEVTAPDGTPITRLWAFIGPIQRLRAETIAEIVAKAKAEIQAERVAAAEAEDMEHVDSYNEDRLQLTSELAAFGVAL